MDDDFDEIGELFMCSDYENEDWEEENWSDEESEVDQDEDGSSGQSTSNRRRVDTNNRSRSTRVPVRVGKYD